VEVLCRNRLPNIKFQKLQVKQKKKGDSYHLRIKAVCPKGTTEVHDNRRESLKGIEGIIGVCEVCTTLQSGGLAEVCRFLLKLRD